MMAWKPLETCPVDEDVLLARRWAGDLYDQPFTTCGYFDPGPKLFWDHMEGAYRSDSTFTHWMPLPEPPGGE